MKFIYLGSEAIRQFGHDFADQVPVEVSDPVAIRKLSGMTNFKVDDGNSVQSDEGAAAGQDHEEAARTRRGRKPQRF